MDSDSLPGHAAVFAEAYNQRSTSSFLSAVKVSLELNDFPSTREHLHKASSFCKPGFPFFVLEALKQVVVATPPEPQIVSLLSELGPDESLQEDSAWPQDGPVLITSVVELLAHVDTEAKRALTVAAKILEVWNLTAASSIEEPLRQVLADAVRRDVFNPPNGDSKGRPAYAAKLLATIPSLLDEEETHKVLRVVDDGSCDVVAENLAANLGKKGKHALVEHRLTCKRFKTANKAVKMFDLAVDFPHVEYEYRANSLRKALEHESRQAAVGITCGEPRLYEPCVRGLLGIGEDTLGCELARAWNIDIPQDVLLEAEARASVVRQDFLMLPPEFAIAVVDTEEAAASMAQVFGQSVEDGSPISVVGFDLEWCPSPESPPTLIQLSSLECAFLVDLPALGSSTVLAEALKSIFTNPAIDMVCFDGKSELAKMTKNYPMLSDSIPPSASLRVIDIKTMVVAKRMQDQGCSKKVAQQKLGLTNVAEEFLGRPLHKALQVCDWSCRPISTAQSDYAALDAYVPAQVYARFFKN